MQNDQKYLEDFIVNSIIGEGSEFVGEFKVDGLIRIDGKFKGLINTNGKVLVGKTGTVDTDIRAKIVVLGGTINGSVYASERVILLATSKLFLLGSFKKFLSASGSFCQSSLISLVSSREEGTICSSISKKLESFCDILAVDSERSVFDFFSFVFLMESFVPKIFMKASPCTCREIMHHLPKLNLELQYLHKV